MNRAALIPPLAPDDRIPHEKAVWRPFHDRSYQGGNRPVSVVFNHFGPRGIHCLMSEDVDWSRATDWRFGWPPA